MRSILPCYQLFNSKFSIFRRDRRNVTTRECFVLSLSLTYLDSIALLIASLGSTGLIVVSLQDIDLAILRGNLQGIDLRFINCISNFHVPIADIMLIVLTDIQQWDQLDKIVGR